MALALRPRAYEALIRPLLFRLPPELAQRMADQALKVWPLWKILGDLSRFDSPVLRTGLPGVGLANPVGLAAGYDKTCSLLPALSALGFGYVTCGTITLHARSGNLGTRVVRDPSRGALINSLGFPNQGLDSAVERMTIDRSRLGNARIVVSVSGTTIDEIVTCHRGVEHLAHAVEINISSPNTAGLRVFHDADVLASLINAVNEGREKPLFVKMPPFPSIDEDSQHHDLILSLAEVCAENGVDAVTVANTLPVRDTRLSSGAGGLSGMPLLLPMLRMVSEVRARVGDSVGINACGGIFSASDAWLAMAAGANTVQLLTAFVYRGPGVANDICRGLAALARWNGLESIRDVVPLAGDERTNEM